MGCCDGFLAAAFEYDTPKYLHVRSKIVGVISRLVQLIILSYIIGFVLVYKNGYQLISENVETSVTTKVKGVEFSNNSDDEFASWITNKDDYRRIWDVADYVVPASENGAFFVTTNLLISHQNRSTCPEDPTVEKALCNNDTDCRKGKVLLLGNGVQTGACVNSTRNSSIHVCEIYAWCPVEIDLGGPLKDNVPLLAGSRNFTVLLKNFIEFPVFKVKRRNILDTSNETYLRKCRYSESNFDCPVFVLDDIVKRAGEDYEKISYSGGIIAIIVNWDCNLDFNEKYCFPTYKFERLDDPSVKLAPGWNFRYAHYYGDDSRTLYKAYGIRFAILVYGRARKFNMVPLLLNVGSGFGLLALEVVVCDIIILYLLKKRKYYKSMKYEQLENDLEGFDPRAIIPNFKRRPSLEFDPTAEADRGYEKLP